MHEPMETHTVHANVANTHTYKYLNDSMGHICLTEDVIIPPIQTENND